MLDLSNDVVLVAFGSTRVPETIRAIRRCLGAASFRDALYLTDRPVLEPGVRRVPTRAIPSKMDYQRFIVNESAEMVLSNAPAGFSGHFLCINWDGFIVNPSAWTPSFLDYDYVGAPWRSHGHKVGNGGFCLKSSRFLRCQLDICRGHAVDSNEDVELCLKLRGEFEARGCRYATTEVGFRFSTEEGDYGEHESFGFHDFRYQPQFMEAPEP